MITKQQFIDNLVYEINIIKHLGEKVTPEILNYRPTEKQRSTLELMQYLGHVITTSVTADILGDQSQVAELAKAGTEVTLENFQEKMNGQARVVIEKIGMLTDEDLEKESTMFGRNATLAMHLLGVLKTAVAYKMQLFLYIKANGNYAIGTSNLWGGIDTPPKA